MSGIREAWEGMEKKLGIDGGARLPDGRTQNEGIGNTIKKNPMRPRGSNPQPARDPRKESTFIEDTMDTIMGLMESLGILKGK